MQYKQNKQQKQEIQLEHLVNKTLQPSRMNRVGCYAIMMVIMTMTTVAEMHIFYGIYLKNKSCKLSNSRTYL